MSGVSVGDLLAEARATGLPVIEARLLLEHCTGRNRTRQMADPDAATEPAQAERFRTLLVRRARGEPIAYLIGQREFFSLAFEVTPAVLIPRPETELLVDLALERLPLDEPAAALDLGTGSGIVPVCLKKHRPQIAMTAVDISPAALEVAGRNAARNGVALELLHSDWYAALAGRRFKLIASNPPYIAHGDHHLDEGDLRFEPRGALTDEDDGLKHIRRIVAEAPAHLEAGGWLLFEHGYDQGPASRELLESAGFAEARSWADLAGIERVSGGRWPAA